MCMHGLCLRMWGSMRRFEVASVQISASIGSHRAVILVLCRCAWISVHRRGTCSKLQGGQAEDSSQQEPHQIIHVQLWHGELFLDPSNTS